MVELVMVAFVSGLGVGEDGTMNRVRKRGVEVTPAPPAPPTPPLTALLRINGSISISHHPKRKKAMNMKVKVPVKDIADLQPINHLNLGQ